MPDVAGEAEGVALGCTILTNVDGVDDADVPTVNCEPVASSGGPG